MKARLDGRARSRSTEHIDIERIAATRMKIRVPNNRRITLPLDVTPGEAEIVVFHSRPTPVARRGSARVGHAHPAFGMWAERADIEDPVAFVNTLRRSIMERRALRRVAS